MTDRAPRPFQSLRLLENFPLMRRALRAACGLLMGAASTAAAAPLDVAIVSAPAVNCLFDAECTLQIDPVDFISEIATTGGILQSRPFVAGEPGTAAEGLYLYVYRVTLAGTPATPTPECVTELDLPFGGIERLDFDGDGTLDDAFEIQSGGAGSVPVELVSVAGDRLQIDFAGDGVCQGAAAGAGDSSYFLGFVSRHSFTETTATLGFNTTPIPETLPVRTPDIPTTEAMEDYAFVWANLPSATQYSPDPFYSYNRAGGSIQISRSSVGTYRVQFDGMDTLWNQDGNVQVSAYGSTTTDDITCNASDWGSDWIDVQCFQQTGALTDSTFTALLAKPKPIREGIAYVRARQPSTSAYSPDPSDVFPASDSPALIQRASTGAYTVRFPGFEGIPFIAPSAGGNVQVTAVNSTNARCHVGLWSATIAGASVLCHDNAGNPVDAEFSLLWMLPQERFDRDLFYVFGGEESASSYNPLDYYVSNPNEGGAFVLRTGVGEYQISIEDLPAFAGPTGGHVQVGAAGLNNARCEIGVWSASATEIDCYDPAGNHIDSDWTLLQLDPTPVPEPRATLLLLVGAMFVACVPRRRSA